MNIDAMAFDEIAERAKRRYRKILKTGCGHADAMVAARKFESELMAVELDSQSAARAMVKASGTSAAAERWGVSRWTARRRFNRAIGAEKADTCTA